IALGVLAWKAGRNLNMLVLNFLAVITGLNAVMDLVGVVNYSNARVGDVVNDAAAFSREVAPILPPVVWAVIWALLAVLILGASVYYSLIKRHIK
ncbi:MAG TPA: M50 family metallopeptidase, partial [Oceanobacillus sp.]|nr:M50 family metallopeptidase [Oceanobacillus sp.]